MNVHSCDDGAIGLFVLLLSHETASNRKRRPLEQTPVLWYLLSSFRHEFGTPRSRVMFQALPRARRDLFPAREAHLALPSCGCRASGHWPIRLQLVVDIQA